VSVALVIGGSYAGIRLAQARGLGAPRASTVPAALAVVSESGPPTPPPPEAVARLRDIRPPVAFAPPWRVVDYVTVVALALILLGIALALAGVFRARKQDPPPAAPIPDAAERALLALEDLERENLFAAPGHEPHVRLGSRIPEILKAFLDARFTARSEYLTTAETYGALLATGDGRLAREVALLLALCDRVKFAGVERFGEDPIGAARDLVRRTAAEAATRGANGGAGG
jgi:hypothetical protein